MPKIKACATISVLCLRTDSVLSHRHLKPIPHTYSPLSLYTTSRSRCHSIWYLDKIKYSVIFYPRLLLRSGFMSAGVQDACLPRRNWLVIPPEPVKPFYCVLEHWIFKRLYRTLGHCIFKHVPCFSGSQTSSLVDVSGVKDSQDTDLCKYVQDCLHVSDSIIKNVHVPVWNRAVSLHSLTQ